MRTAHDPRHRIRQKIVQALYSWSFQPNSKPEDNLASQVISHLTEVDELVKLSAPSRPIGEINRIDLSILRLAIFELVEKKDVPFKVAVDEAIELAKEFGSDSSPGFINGALGNLINRLELVKKS